MHIQNVRDFQKTKPDSELNAPFFFNEHGDPQFFFQVFARSSLIKNTFDEEKKFNNETRFFLWKIVPNWVYFGQGKVFKLTTELSQKVQPSNKNSLNEATLLMSINEALHST